MAKKRPLKKETKAKEPKANRRAIEQYAHDDKDRLNNPPVGLVTPATDPPETTRKTYAYDPHLDPQLMWAGKAERTSFDVPTVSLHVHERIDPKTIIRVVRSNGNGNGAATRKGRGSNHCSRGRTRTRRCGTRSISTSTSTAGPTASSPATACSS